LNSIITVGITGGIGTGKSLVCRIINIMGYPVFYSDDEAKAILANDSAAIKEVTEIFGPLAYNEKGLDLKYISSQVFAQSELLDALNKIVHPKVRSVFNTWRSKQVSRIVFNEAAILFETGAYKNNNYNVLVTSPLQLRKKRIKMRDQLSDEQIESRISKQWSDEKKIPLADFVIVNDEEHLVLQQIQKIVEGITQ